MDTTGEMTVLNTVFDDTIPQTPLDIIHNIGSVEPASVGEFTTPEEHDKDGEDECVVSEVTEGRHPSYLKTRQIKDDPDKVGPLPIKFEQVIIDDLNDEDLSSFNPFCDKDVSTKVASPIVYEVKIKKEVLDDEDIDLDNNEESSMLSISSAHKTKRDIFECSICFKKYKNFKSFKKHERQHNKEKRHVTKEKRMQKILNSSLSNEIIQCLTPKEDTYTCTCGKGYKLRNSVINCLKTHHSEENGELKLDVKNLLKLCGKITSDGTLICKKCDFTCETTQTMIEHKLTHKNKNQIYKCDQCDYSGNRLNTLNRHKLTHTEEKPFSCNKCPYKCKQLTKLKHHQLIHKKTPAYKCDQCSFSCRLRGTLKKHAKDEHGIMKMYYCDQCSYSGTRSSTLQRHILVHQQEKPYACTECNYRCKLSNKLKSHMLTHVKEKNCKCNECGYIAQNMGALKVHKRSHAKRGIFPCDLCPYATPLFEYLEAHKNIHRGKRAYPCMECSYVSTHSSSFRRHLFTHSGEKPFACIHCDFRACQENTLKIHMRTHSGERPYKCDQCDYASSTAGTLKRHKLIHSPIVW